MTDTNEAITPEFISREVARAKQYVIVFYQRTGKPRDDDDELNDLQQKHLQHLFTLRKRGKLTLNGPCLSDSDFRGLSIFSDSSIEEVGSYVDEDPLVKAGYLVGEIYPWMGLPGDRLP